MQQWIVPAVIGALALLAVVLVALLVLARTRTTRELREARAEAASLRAQVEEIERRLAQVASRPRVEAGYVITHLGEEDHVPADRDGARASGSVERVDGALFADLVLRETVVKTASLAHGLRRALAPETRNRIRFEMRREVKRARKQRRREMRDLAQQVRATQRAEDAA